MYIFTERHYIFKQKRCPFWATVTVSVGVEVSSAPQQGAGSIVQLLPSLRCLQISAFVSSNETARKSKISDIVAFTFDNSTKRRLIFQVSFFYKLSVANGRLSSKFQSPNIFFTRHGDQNGRSLERCIIRLSKKSLVKTKSKDLPRVYVFSFQ